RRRSSPSGLSISGLRRSEADAHEHMMLNASEQLVGAQAMVAAITGASTLGCYILCESEGGLPFRTAPHRVPNHWSSRPAAWRPSPPPGFNHIVYLSSPDQSADATAAI